MEEQRPAVGRLTLVGTPIGNLSDLSPRALEALRQCDFIAAEDTRVTLKLLNHFGVSRPLISYFEHLRPAAGGGKRRAGHRCGDARHLRPRGGSGGAVP